MQPRSLEAILSELNPIYQPQEALYRQRQADIPGQIQAEEKGLDAKKDVAFDSILGGARQRGLGFSGIPLAEQAKYTATDYLPAIARLRQSGKEQAMSLEEMILGINERKQNVALNARQYEQQRYDQYMERIRQEEEARRSRAAADAANNSWMNAMNPKAPAGTPNAQRPSLDSIFGTGGKTAAPALKVNSTTANRILPAGSVNPIPTYNPLFGGINTGTSPILQGGGAISGRLSVR